MIQHRSHKRVARPIELGGNPMPMEVAQRLAHLPSMVFLDSSSAEAIGKSGNKSTRQVSIVAARPEAILEGDIHQAGCREILNQSLDAYQVDGMDWGFPTGGLIGWVEYDGQFRFGVYPEMLIYDYSERQWFEIGNLSNELAQCSQPLGADNALEGVRFDYTDSTNREAFIASVERAQEYIAAGDIYQVNLTHQLASRVCLSEAELFAIYRQLRHVSPAPFSAMLNLGNRQVLSTSPEQFLRISDRTIETRPIKGTRPRFSDLERDEKSAYDLITSPKEIAELIMITDLERNDLGQICEFGTVETTELLKLERFAQVFHLVSTVQGQLRDGVSHVDALASCFPGGSITGAPKKRASEIIEELENVPRGLYTGTMGCFGFNGESRFNIAIRTAIYDKPEQQFHFHVGAGIVADSDPEKEWQETFHKAAGILRATTI